MPRKFVERTCTICQMVFEGDPVATVCFNPACRKARQKQFQAAADAKRSAAHRQGVIPVTNKPSPSIKTQDAKNQAAKVPTRKLPWAVSGICEAVALGVSSAPAQKLGVFYVVDFGREGYKPFIPRGDNEWRATSAQKIAVIARLNPRGKWDLRPQEGV